MTHSYHERVFTPTVLDLQTAAGSRNSYAAMSAGERYADRLTLRERDFIGQRDSFYMASVGEGGWPYVQHRGGPKGFMKILDEKTLGFADYSGNRQYVSTGNFRSDDRVSLFFMDYPNRRRLKMLGRVRIVETGEAATLARLQEGASGVQVERGFVITVEGFDWNCPAYITPRFTEDELREQIAAQVVVDGQLNNGQDFQSGATQAGGEHHTGSVLELGEGPVSLVVSGVRQLTPTIRAYELRDPAGADLPVFEAGAHLEIPVQLPGGALTERHYSIASNPARRNVYEIAVLNEAGGRGGSQAVHETFSLGTVIHTGRPQNHFALHEDARPAVLIAGGVGITAVKPMAQRLEARGTAFTLHYAGRQRREMAFVDRLERQLGDNITVYTSEDGARMNLAAVLGAAPADALIYLCGPDRLIAGAMVAAREVGFPRERIRLERFS